MLKKYEISRIAIAEAKKLGFDEPILPKLKKMVINSTLSQTHTAMKHFQTRVFEDYIFSVFNGVVCHVIEKKAKTFATPKEVTCKDCKDTKQVNVFEDCMHCDGTGIGTPEKGALPGTSSDCEYCFGKGGINKTIPCQSCSEKPRKFY